MNNAIGKWINTTCCACFSKKTDLRLKGFSIASFAFTCLNCEPPLNISLPLRWVPIVPAHVTDNQAVGSFIPKTSRVDGKMTFRGFRTQAKFLAKQMSRVGTRTKHCYVGTRVFKSGEP
jgi:hypothetical protein